MSGPFIITNFTSTPPRFFNNLLRKYRKDWKEEYNKTNVALCNKEPDKPLTMLSLILFWLLVNPVYQGTVLQTVLILYKLIKEESETFYNKILITKTFSKKIFFPLVHS